MVMPTYVGQPPPQVFRSNRATEFRGRGRGQSNGGTRLQCQICGKVGHVARRCYLKYDSAYDYDVLNPSVRSGQSNSSGFRRLGSSFSGILTVELLHT